MARGASRVGARDRSPSRRFLPPDPRVAEPHRLTPQLALRVGILGVVVVAVFAVLFLRLWALQVLSSDQYLNAAQNNQQRTVRIQPPRGAILDRNGSVLVGNTAGSAVQLWPADLPVQGRYGMLKKLSRLLNVPVPWMVRQIAKRKDDPLTPVTIKRGVHDDQVNYIKERPEEFQGVRIAETYLRSYPYRALAAQVLGHVGEVTPEQLERRERLRLGDEAGQNGIEAAYDQWLRGEAGTARLRVDSLGRPLGSLVPFQEPRPGYVLRLTIDARLQRAAEQALRYGIQLARENEAWYANGGAIVALNPKDGQVLAMASNPTFKPSVYVGRVEQKKLAAAGLTNATAKAKNFPALNRATVGLYAPGSTWKPVTALAAMQEHLISPYSPLPCTPLYVVRGEDGKDYPFRNWTAAYNVGMTLPRALETSCDTYFYEIGHMFYRLPPEHGHPFQAWAGKFGFGEKTGIDVGPEEAGLLPTPEWRQRTFSSAVDKLWKTGDSIQLAIGQKDLLVTPLQLARFYALVANGGRLVTPYLAVQAERPGQPGSRPDVVQRFTPPPPQPTGVDQAALAAVRDGLVLAARGAEGTATGVFGGFPVKIAGKTGTAEKWSPALRRHLDQSWWCGYGPDDNPEIVVCALIENGGHGGSAAAPAALKVFEEYFHRQASAVTPVATD